jgi:subtilisin family serine protease
LNVPWGLDRIDQVTLPLDNQEFVDKIYTGSGVKVYILDSGILPTHSEFNGRIICGPSFLVSNTSNTDGCDDGTSAGHATHVAGGTCIFFNLLFALNLIACIIYNLYILFFRFSS